MVIKLPRSRESTPVAVTPPSTTLGTIAFRRDSSATRARSASAKRHWCSCWAWMEAALRAAV